MAIQKFYETLIYVNQFQTSDGMGGVVTQYEEGATFKGAIFTTNRQELLIAENKNGVAGYIMATDKTTAVEYGQLFKRLKTGEVFKVKTNPHDHESPPMARVQIKQMELELITGVR